MCLFLNTTEAKIAEKDIICYKIVNATTSPYNENFYANGKLPAATNYNGNKYFFFSPFQAVPIEFGKVMRDEKRLRIKKTYSGKYYPFTTCEKQAKHWRLNTMADRIKARNAKFVLSSGAFHSFQNLSHTKDFFKNAPILGYFMGYFANRAFITGIAKCVIPKGSEYYEGVFESTGIPSYASKEIRYEEIILIED